MLNSSYNTNPSWSWVDFTFILVITILLICGLLVKNFAEEYSTRISLYERSIPVSQSQQNGVEVPVLMVGIKEEGGHSFVLASKAIGKKVFVSTSELKAALSSYRFSKVKMRIDRRIETGLTQELLMDMQELGIQASLSVKRK